MFTPLFSVTHWIIYGVIALSLYCFLIFLSGYGEGSQMDGGIAFIVFLSSALWPLSLAASIVGGVIVGVLFVIVDGSDYIYDLGAAQHHKNKQKKAEAAEAKEELDKLINSDPDLRRLRDLASI